MMLAALALAASAPSFDCRKASTSVERIICGDERLKRSDVAVSTAYRAASRRRVARLASQQKNWLFQRDRCRDSTCLLQRYDERISDLLPLAKTGRHYTGGTYNSTLWVLPLGDGWYSFSVSALYNPPGGVAFDAAASGAFILVGGKAERHPMDERDGWRISRLENDGWRISCLPTETSCGGINVSIDGDYR